MIGCANNLLKSAQYKYRVIYVEVCVGPEVWELGVPHQVEIGPKSGTLQMWHPTLRHLPGWENGDSDGRPIIHAQQKGRDYLNMPTQDKISLHKTSESPAINA